MKQQGPGDYRRILLAIPLALGIALSFFMLMQLLVDNGQSVVEESPAVRVIDFIKEQAEDELETRHRKPRKLQVEQAPEMPEPERDMEMEQNLETDFDVDAAGFSVPLDIDASISGGAGEGDFLPIVKVAPVYPSRALSRGIEGYVLLEFTVTKLGTVTDIRVIESKPKNIFDQAAIRAARKFKYKPRVINGQAVDVPGVQNLIRFKLDG